jgi:hypothetical protein
MSVSLDDSIRAALERSRTIRNIWPERTAESVAIARIVETVLRRIAHEYNPLAIRAGLPALQCLERLNAQFSSLEPSFELSAEGIGAVWLAVSTDGREIFVVGTPDELHCAGPIEKFTLPVTSETAPDIVTQVVARWLADESPLHP